MNWNYFLFHLVAQSVLMQLVIACVSLLQKLVLLPLLTGFTSASMSTFPPLRTLHTWFSRRLALSIPPYAADVSGLSITLWVAITFGSTFLLHLPSMWERRVPLRRPHRALDHEWYHALVLPFWHPPHVAFVLLWVPAKLLRAAATAIVWERGGFNPAATPPVLAGLSVVLSDLWSQVFFIQHDLAGGLLVLLCLLAVEANYTAHLVVSEPGAARLTIPGLIACAFGVTLNLTVWLLNRNRPSTTHVEPEKKAG